MRRVVLAAEPPPPQPAPRCSSCSYASRKKPPTSPYGSVAVANCCTSATSCAHSTPTTCTSVAQSEGLGASPPVRTNWTSGCTACLAGAPTTTNGSPPTSSMSTAQPNWSPDSPSSEKTVNSAEKTTLISVLVASGWPVASGVMTKRSR